MLNDIDLSILDVSGPSFDGIFGPIFIVIWESYGNGLAVVINIKYPSVDSLINFFNVTSDDNLISS